MSREAPVTPPEPLLRIEGVYKYYGHGGHLSRPRSAVVSALDGIDLTVYRGETLGLVGESGSGKSTLARILVRLEEPSRGRVWFDGQDVSALGSRDLRKLRPRLQMIFQDPYASLNPRQTVGDIVTEGLRNQNHSRREARSHAGELLERVGLRAEYANQYPHQFSGGQRQRIGIARALAMSPDLIVCDEPVSALDLSVRAQIINLLRTMQQELKLTYIFIAHDLSVVRHISDRIAVIYLGRIIESGKADEVFLRPRHPFTTALLTSIPELARTGRRRERVLLDDEVPSAEGFSDGCRFAPRCWLRKTLQGRGVDTSPCGLVDPNLEQADGDHLAACHFSDASEQLKPLQLQ
jgi:oligopeptide transport system ATP-binding protein